MLLLVRVRLLVRRGGGVALALLRHPGPPRLHRVVRRVRRGIGGVGRPVVAAHGPATPAAVRILLTVRRVLLGVLLLAVRLLLLIGLGRRLSAAVRILVAVGGRVRLVPVAVLPALARLVRVAVLAAVALALAGVLAGVLAVLLLRAVAAVRLVRAVAAAGGSVAVRARGRGEG